MKYIFKIAAFTLVTALVMVACKKVEDLPFYEDGKSVTLTPSKTTVTAVPADSLNNVIDFSWTSPDYAQDSSMYKFILEIDSTGRNFAKKVTKTVVGVRSVSLTGKELNGILLDYGFGLGTSYGLDVRVISSYGNNNERYTSNVVKINVTPYSDPAVLTTSNTSVTLSLANATLLSNTFSWSPAFRGYTGAITYTLQYDSATKNFVNPIDIPVGVAFFSKGLTQGEMNETALNSGIPGGNTGKVEYRIKATTALGATAYSNVVMVTIQSYVPILRFYMPGSYQVAGGYGATNWEPTTAPEFIRDMRPGLLNNMYYMYIYLPANTEFKVTQGRDWAINYGGSGGVLSAGGANLSVTNAGVYRITINRATMQYDIREGRMGFVGGGTGAGWNPPNVFPTYAMGAPATNLFVGLVDLTVDNWKMIDSDTWNNGSNTVGETRSYGTLTAPGTTMQVNGDNFAAFSPAGRYRVIWDGRNVDNIKYELNPATEMRLVGNGIDQVGVNDWDPPTSPQMTYSGNGVWTITIALKANKEIKFLAGNAWGAFDYEDNSGGSNAVGVPRPIKWDGGGNFNTPAAAGTYTITLNEKTQRVVIN